MRIVSIFAAGLLLAAAKPQPTTEEVGPGPAFAETVAAIELAVRARLAKPDSAKFEWPYGFSAGAITVPGGRRHVGWITCGLVNAQNRSGAFNGRSYVQAVVHNGSIGTLDIGTGDNHDRTGPSCRQLINDRFLQAVPAAKLNLPGTSSSHWKFGATKNRVRRSFWNCRRPWAIVDHAVVRTHVPPN